jgi:hypothetical protein
VRWEVGDWVTLRAGITTTSARFVVPSIGLFTRDKYTFQGFGVLVDHDNVVLQAEAVKRASAGFPFIVNSTGWYVLGGYRFGKLLPYASYASTTKSTPYTPGLALSYDQSTTAVGVRWDAFSSADIKFQAERVDPKGTDGISFTQASPSFGSKSVDVFSLAIDFVF